MLCQHSGHPWAQWVSSYYTLPFCWINWLLNVIPLPPLFHCLSTKVAVSGGLSLLPVPGTTTALLGSSSSFQLSTYLRSIFHHNYSLSLSLSLSLSFTHQTIIFITLKKLHSCIFSLLSDSVLVPSTLSQQFPALQ